MERFWRVAPFRSRVLRVRHHSGEETSMNSLLQLLVGVGVAVAGAIIALRIDKKEHRDSKPNHFDYPGGRNDREHRGAAMSSYR